jgi:hypothetical protein
MTYGSNNSPKTVSFTQGVDNPAIVAQSQISKALLLESEARVALENANFRLSKATELLRDAEITYRETISKSVWNKDEIRKAYNEATARFRDADKKVAEATEAFTKAQETVASLRSIAKGEVVKREFSDTKRQELASKGHAMPDGSYPIETKADLANAIQSVGRAKDYDATKKHIIEQAKRIGAMDALPESWKSPTATMKSVADLFKGEASGKKCPLCKGEGTIRGGNVTCPECKGKKVVMKGDVMGHVFHGNQYSAGSGANKVSDHSENHYTEKVENLGTWSHSKEMNEAAAGHRLLADEHNREAIAVQNPMESHLNTEVAHADAMDAHHQAAEEWEKAAAIKSQIEAGDKDPKLAKMLEASVNNAHVASGTADDATKSVVSEAMYEDRNAQQRGAGYRQSGVGAWLDRQDAMNKSISKATALLVVCPACQAGNAMPTCEYCDGEGQVPAEGEQDDTMNGGMSEDDSSSSSSSSMAKALFTKKPKKDEEDDSSMDDSSSSSDGGGFTTNELLYPLTKGDVDGHPFHGNQYQSGTGGGNEWKGWGRKGPAVGTRVRVSEGSGLASGKTGTVINPREIQTDGRGIPKIDGHYKPVNYREQSAIRYDNGQVDTMYNNRLRPE